MDIKNKSESLHLETLALQLALEAKTLPETSSVHSVHMQWNQYFTIPQGYTRELM